MSQKLALFPIALADAAESAAYGLIVLLALAAGFGVAWLIQSARRRDAVQELIDRQLENERAQIEDSRLLAEDLVMEQASQLAQQARRIEHLKGRLAQQLAQSGQAATDPGTAGTASGQRTEQATSALAARAAQMAARAATTHRATLTPQQVSAATAAIQEHLRKHRQPASRSPASAPDYLRDPEIHDQGMGGTELLVLRRQLALEKRNTREKARILRGYEQDVTHWRAELAAAGEQRQKLQASIASLEKLLDETRKALINSEREATQLRDRLRQQQAQALMEGAQLAREHTANFRQPGAREEVSVATASTTADTYSLNLGGSYLARNRVEHPR